MDKPQNRRRVYILYDGRALLDGPDNAQVLEVLGSFRNDKAAMACARQEWDGFDGCVFSYASNGSNLTDEQYVDAMEGS